MFEHLDPKFTKLWMDDVDQNGVKKGEDHIFAKSSLTIINSLSAASGPRIGDPQGPNPPHTTSNKVTDHCGSTPSETTPPHYLTFGINPDHDHRNPPSPNVCIKKCFRHIVDPILGQEERPNMDHKSICDHGPTFLAMGHGLPALQPPLPPSPTTYPLVCRLSKPPIGAKLGSSGQRTQGCGDWECPRVWHARTTQTCKHM